MDDSNVVRRCPVTFVGKKLVKDDDTLNNLFIMPYEMNMVSSISNAMSECKNVRDKRLAVVNPTNEEKDEILSRAINYEADDVTSFASNVTAFMVMNIRDIVYNSLLKMGKDFIPTSFDPLNCVESIVLNGVKSLNLSRYIEVDALNTDINKAMDVMYGMIITMIFDPAIIEYCNKAIANNTFDNLFKSVFMECYGEDSYVPELANKEIDFKYTFVSSCLREKMQPILINLRQALCAIAFSATTMIYDAPIVRREDYMNKDFNPNDLVARIPELGMAVGNILIGENNENCEQ